MNVKLQNEGWKRNTWKSVINRQQRMTRWSNFRFILASWQTDPTVGADLSTKIKVEWVKWVQYPWNSTFVMLMTNTLESVILAPTYTSRHPGPGSVHVRDIGDKRERRRSPYCKNATNRKHSSERKDTCFVYSSG